MTFSINTLCHGWCTTVVGFFFFVSVMCSFSCSSIIKCMRYIYESEKKRQNSRKVESKRAVYCIWVLYFPFFFCLMWFEILDRVIFISLHFFSIFSSFYSDLACSFFQVKWKKNPTGRSHLGEETKSFPLIYISVFLLFSFVNCARFVVNILNRMRYYIYFDFILFLYPSLPLSFVVFFHIVVFVFVLVYNRTNNHVVPLESFHHHHFVQRTRKKQQETMWWQAATSATAVVAVTVAITVTFRFSNYKLNLLRILFRFQFKSLFVCVICVAYLGCTTHFYHCQVARKNSQSAWNWAVSPYEMDLDRSSTKTHWKQSLRACI